MTTSQNPGTDMFRASDALDVDGWVAYLAPGVRFRFGNADPLTGREAVRQAVAEFFTTISGLRHTIVRDWRADDMIIQKLEVTYTRRDGKTVTVPAVNLLRVSDGLIADYEIYVDLAPVYA
jgi:ketosteroid isomerase-like protein